MNALPYMLPTWFSTRSPICSAGDAGCQPVVPPAVSAAPSTTYDQPIEPTLPVRVGFLPPSTDVDGERGEADRLIPANKQEFSAKMACSAKCLR